MIERSKLTHDPQPARLIALAQCNLKAAYRHLAPDEADLCELAAERLGAGRADADTPDSAVIRAVKFAFSRLLYQAYLRDGTEAQERAFRAAQAYLYPMLLYRVNWDEALADDLTQEALFQVWASIRKKPLRESGAFLSYILQTGLHLLFRSYKRKPPESDRGPEAEDAADSDPAEKYPEAAPDLRATETQAEHHLLYERVRAAIRRCLENNDRYIRIIEEHCLDGKSFRELAQQWQCTAARLHLIKHRALEKLKNCPEVGELG